MSLHEFTNDELREIYVLCRKTLNHIQNKDESYRMPPGPLFDPNYLPKLVQGTTNDDYFKNLVEVVFFVHAVAKGVKKRLPRIKEKLGDYRVTRTYGEQDVIDILTGISSPGAVLGVLSLRGTGVPSSAQSLPRRFLHPARRCW